MSALGAEDVTPRQPHPAHFDFPPLSNRILFANQTRMSRLLSRNHATLLFGIGIHCDLPQLLLTPNSARACTFLPKLQRERRSVEASDTTDDVKSKIRIKNSEGSHDGDLRLFGLFP